MDTHTYDTENRATPALKALRRSGVRGLPFYDYVDAGAFLGDLQDAGATPDELVHVFEEWRRRFPPGGKVTYKAILDAAVLVPVADNSPKGPLTAGYLFDLGVCTPEVIASEWARILRALYIESMKRWDFQERCETKLEVVLGQDVYERMEGDLSRGDTLYYRNGVQTLVYKDLDVRWDPELPGHHIEIRPKVRKKPTLFDDQYGSGETQSMWAVAKKQLWDEFGVLLHVPADRLVTQFALAVCNGCGKTQKELGAEGPAHNVSEIREVSQIETIGWRKCGSWEYLATELSQQEQIETARNTRGIYLADLIACKVRALRLKADAYRKAKETPKDQKEETTRKILDMVNAGLLQPEALDEFGKKLYPTYGRGMLEKSPFLGTMLGRPRDAKAIPFSGATRNAVPGPWRHESKLPTIPKATRYNADPEALTAEEMEKLRRSRPVAFAGSGNKYNADLRAQDVEDGYERFR